MHRTLRIPMRGREVEVSLRVRAVARSAEASAELPEKTIVARERTAEHIAGAIAAADRLQSIAIEMTRRKATVAPTGKRIWRWRVTRSFTVGHLYDGGLSYHLSERTARRKAARWLAGGDRPPNSDAVAGRPIVHDPDL